MLRRLLLTGMIALTFAGDAMAATKQVAVFAGGCFWSTQKAFDHVKGVTDTRAGFMGGSLKNPSYNDVLGGDTGHVEAVEVSYDPDQVTYEQLLDTYWHSTDPTTQSRVICDAGEQYRTAIFTFTPAQQAAAVASKQAVGQQLGKPIRTLIVRSVDTGLPFYPAEAYHQHYWQTHKDHYDRYVIGCGRPGTLKRLWGDQALK